MSDDDEGDRQYEERYRQMEDGYRLLLLTFLHRQHRPGSLTLVQPHSAFRGTSWAGTEGNVLRYLEAAGLVRCGVASQTLQQWYAELTPLGLHKVTSNEREHMTKSVEINISGQGHSIQAGDHNTQIFSSIQALVAAIDSSSGTPAEKIEAKGRLQRFLEHPLITAIAGGLAGSVIGGNT